MSFIFHTQHKTAVRINEQVPPVERTHILSAAHALFQTRSSLNVTHPSPEPSWGSSESLHYQAAWKHVS